MLPILLAGFLELRLAEFIPGPLVTGYPRRLELPILEATAGYGNEGSQLSWWPLAALARMKVESAKMTCFNTFQQIAE